MANEDLNKDEIEASIAVSLAQDKARYDRVMEEIAKDEAEALERLRKVRQRREIVRRIGYYGSANDGEVKP
jgi:hypothetical protein